MTYTLRDPDGCALPLDDVLAEDADLDCVGDVPGRYARVAASVGRSRGAGVVRSWIIEDGEGEVAAVLVLRGLDFTNDVATLEYTAVASVHAPELASALVAGAMAIFRKLRLRSLVIVDPLDAIERGGPHEPGTPFLQYVGRRMHRQWTERGIAMWQLTSRSQASPEDDAPTELPRIDDAGIAPRHLGSVGIERESRWPVDPTRLADPLLRARELVGVGVEPDDARFVARLQASGSAMSVYGSREMPYADRIAQRWLHGDRFDLLVVDAERAAAVGVISLFNLDGFAGTVELSAVVATSWRGNAAVPGVVAEAIDYAFSFFAVDHVVFHCNDVALQQYRRLIEIDGIPRVCLKELAWVAGAWRDVYDFFIPRETWRSFRELHRPTDGASPLVAPSLTSTSDVIDALRRVLGLQELDEVTLLDDSLLTFEIAMHVEELTGKDVDFQDVSTLGTLIERALTPTSPML